MDKEKEPNIIEQSKPDIKVDEVYSILTNDSSTKTNNIATKKTGCACSNC